MGENAVCVSAENAFSFKKSNVSPFQVCTAGCVAGDNVTLQPLCPRRVLKVCFVSISGMQRKVVFFYLLAPSEGCECACQVLVLWTNWSYPSRRICSLPSVLVQVEKNIRCVWQGLERCSFGSVEARAFRFMKSFRYLHLFAIAQDRIKVLLDGVRLGFNDDLYRSTNFPMRDMRELEVPLLHSHTGSSLYVFLQECWVYA